MVLGIICGGGGLHGSKLDICLSCVFFFRKIAIDMWRFYLVCCQILFTYRRSARCSAHVLISLAFQIIQSINHYICIAPFDNCVHSAGHIWLTTMKIGVSLIKI